MSIISPSGKFYNIFKISQKGIDKTYLMGIYFIVCRNYKNHPRFISVFDVNTSGRAAKSNRAFAPGVNPHIGTNHARRGGDNLTKLSSYQPLPL